MSRGRNLLLINLLFIEIYCYNQESTRDWLVTLPSQASRQKPESKHEGSLLLSSPSGPLISMSVTVIYRAFFNKSRCLFSHLCSRYESMPGDIVVNKRDEILDFLQHQF